MKPVLSFLLCFVLLEAQTMAQSHIAPNGGPNYGNLGSITGTYSGVLVPSSTTTSSQGVSTTPVANALGLFTLSIPTTGPGTGSFLVFMGNRILDGTINAVADPSSETILGILNATFNYTLSFILNTSSGAVLETEQVTATVTGTLDATVGQVSSGVSTLQSLTGTAVLQIDQGQVSGNGNPIITQGPLDFTVEGTQQSTSNAPGTFTTG